MFFFALFVLGFIQLQIAYSAESEMPMIVTHGDGELHVRPDLLRIELLVSSRGKTAKEAQDYNGEESADLGKKLRELGVEVKDVQTQNYFIEPQYDMQKNKRIFHGYAANNYLLVRVHKPETVAGLLDNIVDEDDDEKMVSVIGIHFGTEMRQEYEIEVLTKAVANARAHAEAIAKAAGRTVKEIRRIVETQVNMNLGASVPHIVGGTTVPNITPVTSSQGLAPGEIMISSSVTIEFQMM